MTPIGLTDGSDASDESADDPTPTVVAPIRWSPPSGKRIAEYLGWELWSKSRWAWEFLRRNGDFQKDCDAPRSYDAIADKYRLRRFKHFAEGYAYGRKAKFASGIQSIPRREEFEKRITSSSSLETDCVHLLPSEVLIRFQLAPTRLAQTTSNATRTSRTPA